MNIANEYKEKLKKKLIENNLSDLTHEVETLYQLTLIEGAKPKCRICYKPLEDKHICDFQNINH